ncbi:hypothetical protein LSG31_18965 [Fodinisporobacter ferrooxydans]|uniref:Uncharacterized protein n=1 Tax=Fodinisporobacter ferrooxydans TaxID=2901836 RepID=A0ABY4CQ09_9BACL|nr:hypothetical protein LSG31_18965 [Alicyclobacillaceae bacterium MYW30-H2]
MKTAIIEILFRLDWIGLDWIGLDWIGLDWIGLDWMQAGATDYCIDWEVYVCLWNGGNGWRNGLQIKPLPG